MPKKSKAHPTQTQLAAQGIEILRQELDFVGCYDGEAEEALRALCDYAERTIQSRAAGGKKAGAKTGAENGKKRVKAQPTRARVATSLPRSP